MSVFRSLRYLSRGIAWIECLRDFHVSHRLFTDDPTLIATAVDYPATIRVSNT